MRSFVSSLALFAALSLHAESPKLTPPDSARQQQTLEAVKQFALTHFAEKDNLSCTQAASPGASKTVTVELSELPAQRRGFAPSVETGNRLQDVFAVSSQTEFHWDHWATLKGKAMSVYNYSFQINGQTHAGSIFADENTGAISRVTFRGADASAHLFCSVRTR